jgi:hypothetical protein
MGNQPTDSLYRSSESTSNRFFGPGKNRLRSGELPGLHCLRSNLRRVELRPEPGVRFVGFCLPMANLPWPFGTLFFRRLPPHRSFRLLAGDHLGCHPMTLFRTSAASLGASLTMVRFMFLAFGGAGFADLGADPT